MAIKIVEKKETPLLLRKEIKAELDYDKTTPSNKEIREKLAQSLNAKPELVVVKKIEQKFGLRKAIAIIYVYENEKDMKKIEVVQKKPEKGKKKEEKQEPEVKSGQKPPAEAKEAKK